MSNVINELRKVAWVEQVIPASGELAPFIERAIRRGARLTIQDAANTASNTPRRKEEKPNVSK